MRWNSKSPLSSIKAGFQKSGIYALDRNVFNGDDFLTSYVTDREYDKYYDDLNENLVKETNPKTALTLENVLSEVNELQVFICIYFIK